MNNKEKFISLLKSTNRKGVNQLLSLLEEKSFFEAPASTRFHLSKNGGLLQHSINVYKRFVKLLQSEYGDNWTKKVSPESVAVMGLLHDVCKVNTYVEDVKNVKNQETGKWEQKPYFRYEDNLPYGHGEKSVYIISAFIKLSREEALAINWHMGEYDIRVKNGSFMMSDVYYKYPICFLLHLADLSATYLDEKPAE